MFFVACVQQLILVFPRLAIHEGFDGALNSHVDCVDLVHLLELPHLALAMPSIA